MVVEAPQVTFLFTDLEGSTRMWERDPTAMQEALADHNTDMERAFADNNGSVVKLTGDGALAVFDTVPEAIDAAIQAQRALEVLRSEELGPVRARMAIHVATLGDIENGCYEVDGDYLGPALHRCARLMAIAHGGQVILSSDAAGQAREAAPQAFELRDLGRHQLRDLAEHERVFQVEHPDLWPEFPPLRSIEAYPGNLPNQLTSFVGRDGELEELAERLAESQLVTLTGVGGVGKTRLAVHTAARLIDRHEHGAWFVDLAPLSDPELVPATVAATLKVRERRGEAITDTICDFLSERSLLLIVDNCEHVIGAAAEFIEAVHLASPRSSFLATSREALWIHGEQTWSVGMLGTPDPDTTLAPDQAAAFEAIELFVDRARRADEHFALDEDNVDAVASICRRLEGIPLAIELAASRCAVMSAGEIEQRLDARFSLLTDGARTEAAHRQTLRGTVDWSHDLLSLEEQQLFRRLSVFAGGWTLGDAEAVGPGPGIDRDDVLDLLAGLARKSMIVVVRGEGTTRYRLLELLREYGRERLEEANEQASFRERHASHFHDRILELEHDLRGPGQAAAYASLESEIDNIRTAFDWFISTSESAVALQIVRVLRTYWAEHMPTEGFLRAMHAVEVGDDASAIQRAGGLADASWIGFMCEREEVQALARQSIELSESAASLPDPEALLLLGLVALYDGDLEESLAHFERATQVSRESDDRYEIAAGQTGVSFLRAMLGDVDGAIQAGDEAVTLGRDLGYDTQIAGGLAALGFSYGAVDAEHSVALLVESLAIKDNTTYSAVARVLLAHLRILLDQLPEALNGFCGVLEVHRVFGDTYFVPMSLEGMASVFSLLGRPETAARVLGGSAAARRKLGLPGLEIELALLEGTVALVQGALDAETLTRERNLGESWTLDETIEFALTESRDLLPVVDLRGASDIGGSERRTHVTNP